ncbi:MAG: hypothetical protein BroJett040_06930 [Oligoflexia bacterium]|nr:MAG: hypothetical protein BroJett040_06930 [Oligoflexia bacterium]
MLSCSTKKEDSLEERLTRVQQEIEVQRYDQATSEINSIIEEYPDSDRAKTIKASIYVHKAGIRLKDYFEFEKALTDERVVVTPLINDEQLAQLQKLIKDSGPGLVQMVEQMNSVHNDFQDFSKRVERLPSLMPEREQDFQTALDVLASLQKPNTGQYLYRSVIKTIYFKHLWVTGQLNVFDHSRFCYDSITSIRMRINNAYAWMRSILEDGRQGIPSKAKTIEKILTESELAINEFNKAFGQLETNQNHFIALIDTAATAAGVNVNSVMGDLCK